MHFQNLYKRCYSEVSHVVIGRIKKFVEGLMATLDQVRMGINVRNGFYRLEQNTVVEMHTKMCASPHNSVQSVIH